MEHFRYLLKNLFDSPALQVVMEHILGRIKIGIEKVRNQCDVRLTGPLQRDLPDIAALAMARCSHPSPFLEKGSALGVGPCSHGTLRIAVKTDLGMATNQKVISSL